MPQKETNNRSAVKTPINLILKGSERLRIHVVGTSGAGKSTLARQLSERLSVPYIEIDALHWLADWKEEENARFREKLRHKISGPVWVLDGNYYSKSSDIQWDEKRGATTVVWCDYSFPITFFRAVKRAFSRAWRQQEIWPETGNRETFRKSFCSHDSIILWTIISYRSNKKRYSEIVKNGSFAHIRFIRLRSPKECASFLRQF